MQNNITVQEIVDLLHKYKTDNRELRLLLERIKERLDQINLLPISDFRTVADVKETVKINGIYQNQNKGVIIAEENLEAGELSISDIHGDFGVLCSLLPKMIETLNNGGIVVVNGDMIDPIFYSEEHAQLEVLLTVFVLMDRYPRQCFFTKGNHESDVPISTIKEIIGEKRLDLSRLLGDILESLPGFVISCPTEELYSHTGAFDAGIGKEKKPSVRNLFTQIHEKNQGSMQYDPITAIAVNPTALVNAKAVGFRRVNKGHDHMTGEMTKVAHGSSFKYVKFTDEIHGSAQICQTFSNATPSQNILMVLQDQNSEELLTKLNNNFMEAKKTEYGVIELTSKLPSCYIHDATQEAIVSFNCQISTAEALEAIEKNDSSMLPVVTKFTDTKIILPPILRENLNSNKEGLILLLILIGIFLLPIGGVGIILIAIAIWNWKLLPKKKSTEEMNKGNTTGLPNIYPEEHPVSVDSHLPKGEVKPLDSPDGTPSTQETAALDQTQLMEHKDDT